MYDDETFTVLNLPKEFIPSDYTYTEKMFTFIAYILQF